MKCFTKVVCCTCLFRFVHISTQSSSASSSERMPSFSFTVVVYQIETDKWACGHYDWGEAEKHTHTPMMYILYILRWYSIFGFCCRRSILCSSTFHFVCFHVCSSISIVLIHSCSLFSLSWCLFELWRYFADSCYSTESLYIHKLNTDMSSIRVNEKWKTFHIVLISWKNSTKYVRIQFGKCFLQCGMDNNASNNIT